MRSWLAAILLLAALPAPGEPAPETLEFRIDEGRNINSFFRKGPVAAHLLLRSGTEPRLLVAFPAGNSGVGLWFETAKQPVSWTLTSPPRALKLFQDIHRPLERPLYGISFEVETDAPELRIRRAVLSSVRVLRDYEQLRTAPDEVLVAAQVEENHISWARDRLDGAPGYALTIDVSNAASLSGDRIAAGPSKRLRLRIQALTGETPFQPLQVLLTTRAGNDERARNALAFLSYSDKFLAGSWRFNTYFGRDTLISALLLAPVLEPEALESAIASVLDRLAPNGEVAHEEDIGEFAVLRNLREGRGRVAAPVYDYGMVDDDFLLAPLAARWLLDDARGAARARAFLAEPGAGGIKRGASLARNLVWLVERAAVFAETPRFENLVGIKAGRMTGNWRDSEQGLGRGRYAYDVNAALVPAALEAAAGFSEARTLDGYLDAAQRRTLSRAREYSKVWSQHAPRLFAVDIPSAQARAAVTAYAKEIGVEEVTDAVEGSLVFHALSLGETGQPVPILHSDEGFRLLLTEPAEAELSRCLTAIMRPFPAGLLTDAGMLVANPALASAEVRNEFTRSAYHGTVVWSWQQALMAAGIERQLRRPNLSEAQRAQLLRARSTVWAAIDRSAPMRTSELWSWAYQGGQFRIEPFGRRGADADESNAAQLWSTVYLGLPHPR